MALTATAPARTGVRFGADPALIGALAALVCVLPIAALIVLAASGGGDTLRHLAETRLTAYARNSAALAALVALGVSALGVPTAWLVARYRFPGRGVFAWALALPLAAPTYVLAYAWSSLVNAGGPLYGALPPLRGVFGAAFIFSIALYPYVYLLARQAFEANAGHAMDAARTLGAGPVRAFWRVGLPLARPAIAAGMALAIMETLADYGAVDYLGAPTFTTGIVRAWLSDPAGAARLAVILLLATLLALGVERRSRGKGRIADPRGRVRAPERMALRPLAGAFAFVFCLAPIVIALLLPVARLGWLAVETEPVRPVLPALLNTAGLALASALIAAALGLGAATAALSASRLGRIAARTAQLGYAIPGAVAAMGVIALLGGVQRLLDAQLGALAPFVTGGSLVALVFAYQSRFAAAAIGPSESALLRVTPSLEAAARTLGETPMGVLRRVRFPLALGGVATAALIVFVEVMKELPATMILRPLDFETLAVVAHNYAADERLPQAARPALLLIALGLAPMALVSRLVSGLRR
jgi:iron(III) transport system permease protein